MKLNFREWSVIVLLLLAAILPWGSLPYDTFGNTTLTVTAWSGTITLFGIKIPAWFLVLATLAALGINIIKRHKRISLPPAVPLLLNIIAFLWLLAGVWLYSTIEGTTLGIGLIIALVANIITFVALFKRAMNPSETLINPHPAPRSATPALTPVAVQESATPSPDSPTKE